MADKYINATQMLVDEQEAYMTAQLKADDMTQKINEIVHIKLQKLLFDAPAEDVQEVRHGEWEQKNDIFTCSECGYQFECEGYTQFFNFCPNCGCKMDGETNDP